MASATLAMCLLLCEGVHDGQAAGRPAAPAYGQADGGGAAGGAPPVLIAATANGQSVRVVQPADTAAQRRGTIWNHAAEVSLLSREATALCGSASQAAS